MSRKIDPFHCSLTYILDFLAELYTSGLAYRTINCHRSALSAYHDSFDGFPIGQHPRVKSLMTGIFNNRPSQPRYTFIWDVEQVLNYVRALKPNEELSNKDLTLKTTILLALTAASRSSELKFLSIQYMIRSESSYVFTFNRLFKSWRNGKSPPSLEFSSFPAETNLCVYTSLDTYLKRSSDWRKDDQKQLLLSHIRPHKEITKSTIARWIMCVLKMSGIDTTTFKAHSVRSAASSKAKAQGLSTKDILSRGNWSSDSTFQKFYNKPILLEKTSKTFQTMVLKSKSNAL